MSSTLSIDAMGGDFGPQVTVPASLACLRKNPHLKLIMVGDEAVLSNLLSEALVEFKDRIRIQHASQVVEMDEPPQKALKNKKDSSMRVAINLVKEGRADACVSAGNTGALMATARFVLKMIPGIERPAIISTLPSIFGHTHVLDLGANVDSSAEHLYQFAVMGEEVVKAVENIERPRVGLLNIGEEDMKGNEQVKAAAKLLENSNLNYIGYVEGNSINAGSEKGRPDRHRRFCRQCRAQIHRRRGKDDRRETEGNLFPQSVYPILGLAGLSSAEDVQGQYRSATI